MAQNVIISGIYLGNAADMDTFEGNYAVENANDILGTFGSPAEPLYKNRVDIDTDSPTQFIDTNQDTGNGTLSYDAGAGPVTTGLDSFITYNSVITFNDGSQINIAIDVAQTMNGDLFLLAWDNYGVLESQGIESVQLTSVDFSEWGGFQQSSYDDRQFVCFAPGTAIATPGGERPVEMLREGDMVLTADRGAQPLRWVGARSLRFPGAPDRQKPIEIKPGALGPGMPRRRLVVSPQHRILVPRRGGEGLVHAHMLEGLPGVRRMHGKRRVTYVALLCDRHEIIMAEGTRVESLYPGAMAFAVLSAFQRLEILARVPTARIAGAVPGASGYGPLARPMVRRRDLGARLAEGGAAGSGLIVAET